MCVRVCMAAKRLGRSGTTLSRGFNLNARMFLTKR